MEREDFKGKIDIRIIREPQEIAPVEGINSTINEIIGFSISDNGIGLDDNNMYKYHEKKRAYIELISYDKLILDAEKRNKVLFEKLGI